MRIEQWAEGAATAVILGHIHPDGDCVGSCLGLKNYLRTVRPDLKVQVVLGLYPKEFSFLQGAAEISHDYADGKTYDVCFALDASDTARLGKSIGYFRSARRTVCIDHHVTNPGFADVNVIRADASSTSELLTTLMDWDAMNRDTAECLYLGIVHDTGVFKYSNTCETTMRTAGALISKGVSPAQIIDDTFYRKTFAQNRALGEALVRAELLLDGRMIATHLTEPDLDRCGVTNRDLDGIIDQLRVTEGVEVAAFLYEIHPGEFKVSLRSNSTVDVSRIASDLGGGGHEKAAGCNVTGDYETNIRQIAQLAAQQMDVQG